MEGRSLEDPPGLLEGVAELGTAQGSGEGVVGDGDVLLSVVGLDGSLQVTSYYNLS